MQNRFLLVKVKSVYYFCGMKKLNFCTIIFPYFLDFSSLLDEERKGENTITLMYKDFAFLLHIFFVFLGFDFKKKKTLKNALNVIMFMFTFHFMKNTTAPGEHKFNYLFLDLKHILLLSFVNIIIH